MRSLSRSYYAFFKNNKPLHGRQRHHELKFSVQNQTSELQKTKCCCHNQNECYLHILKCKWVNCVRETLWDCTIRNFASTKCSLCHPPGISNDEEQHDIFTDIQCKLFVNTKGNVYELTTRLCADFLKLNTHCLLQGNNLVLITEVVGSGFIVAIILDRLINNSFATALLRVIVEASSVFSVGIHIFLLSSSHLNLWQCRMLAC